MTLLIKKPTFKSDTEQNVAEAKASTLAEKTNGFQFKKPTIASTPTATREIIENGNGATNQKGSSEEPRVDTGTNRPNGNGLLEKKISDEGKPVANQFKKPSDPIPEMSDDKYEVTADAVPEFSAEAGNKFQEQLEMLQAAIDGTGDLKDQMENILTFLDDNPQYKENVSPKDVSVFVTACRKVAGITVTEKTERKTRKTKVSAQVEDVLADLADLEFDL